MLTHIKCVMCHHKGLIRLRNDLMMDIPSTKHFLDHATESVRPWECFYKLILLSWKVVMWLCIIVQKRRRFLISFFFSVAVMIPSVFVSSSQAKWVYDEQCYGSRFPQTLFWIADATICITLFGVFPARRHGVGICLLLRQWGGPARPRRVTQHGV